MPTIVGVKLRFSSKALSFDPAGAEVGIGDTVIVETERGAEIGEVVEPPHEVAARDLVAPLKPVIRVASEQDLQTAARLREQETEALPVFREMVKGHKLEMKPIGVEFLFDGSKVIFYFSADERVDFRDLVRDLASRFKARIDMRQIGVRDEARMVGGIGHCGQILCCERFPGDFQPVSIRMAKEQDLPLNPLKISGLCGRLMCCLRYEYDAYKDFKSRAPKRRATIETPLGLAKVTDLNTPKETVSMRLEDGQSLTVPLCSMQCPKEGGRPCSVSREGLEEAGAILPVEGGSLLGGELSEGSGSRGGQRSTGARRSGGRTSSGPSRRSGGEKSAEQPAEKSGERSDGGREKSVEGDAGKSAGQGSRSSSGSRRSSGKRRTGSGGEAAQPAATEAQGSKAPGGSGRKRRRRRPPASGSEQGGTTAT